MSSISPPVTRSYEVAASEAITGSVNATRTVKLTDRVSDCVTPFMIFCALIVACRASCWAVGVPVITTSLPVVGLKVNPGGKLVALQSGAGLPVALSGMSVIVCPTRSVRVNGVVVMFGATSGGLTVNVMSIEAEGDTPLDAVNVTTCTPSVVGVPDKVVPEKFNPGGNVPPV